MARNVRTEDTTSKALWPLFWLADEVIYSLHCGFSIWRWCLNNCICVSVLGDNFEKYLEAFKPYLLLGLKNYAEYQVLFVLQYQKLAFHYVLVLAYVYWNAKMFHSLAFEYTRVSFFWVPVVSLSSEYLFSHFLLSLMFSTVETECDIYFQQPVGFVQVTSKSMTLKDLLCLAGVLGSCGSDRRHVSSFGSQDAALL